MLSFSSLLRGKTLTDPEHYYQLCIAVYFNRKKKGRWFWR